MSTKIIDWFEEKAKRLGLRSEYDTTAYGEWYHREKMRQVDRMIEANNRWMLQQKQFYQQSGN